MSGSAHEFMLFTGRTLSTILALAFILSALAKSIQPEPLEKMLSAAGVGSGRTMIVFLLSAFEMFLGVWLILSKEQLRPLVILAGVLTIFTVGVQILMTLGIEDSCGCFGTIFEGTLDSTRKRNVLFLIACLTSLALLWCSSAPERT